MRIPSKMDVVILKVILLIIMVLGTLIFGLLPIRVLKFLRKNATSSESQHRSASLILCLLTCFSGGVFLATCFLDLLPDVNEHLVRFRRISNIDSDYPFAELISCIGFFLVYGLEELVLKLISGFEHSHPPADLNIVENDNKPNCDTSGLDDEFSKGPLLNSNLALNSVGNGCAQSRTEMFAIPMTTDHYSEPERCEVGCERINEDPPIKMNSRPHAHSHGVRSVTFVLALSFHGVLEGLAFGVQKQLSAITTLFLSLAIHKAIVAFSVGLQLARTHAHQLGMVTVSIFVLAFMTPVGAVIGLFVQESEIDTQIKDILVLIFEGLAVGTFLYVTFFEILLHERDNEHPNLLKLLVVVIGFTVVALFRILEHGDHTEHVHISHQLNGTFGIDLEQNGR